MRWRGIALIALLAGTGCSFRSALEDFCEDTGECACADGNCCAVYRERCGGIGCCTGMFCNAEGYCERDFEPRLVIPQVATSALDLPAVEPGQSTGPVVLEILNDGAGPTTQLQLKYEGSSRITADLSACAGRVLEAGEKCEVVVSARPDAYAEYTATLEVKELGASAAAVIRATGGAAVEVTPSQVWVWSTPEGINCPGQCKHLFPVGTAVKLSIGGTMWGTHGVLWPTRVVDGFCDQTTGTCDVVANSRVLVTSSAQPNLTLVLHGAGRIDWVGNAFGQSRFGFCTATTSGQFNACLAIVQDTVTFSATQGTVASWSGPCAGQGNICTTTIPAFQASTLEVTFQ